MAVAKKTVAKKAVAKKTARPKTQKQVAAQRSSSAKKGHVTRKAMSATESREQWETANPQRFTDLADTLGDKWKQDGALHDRIKRAGLDPGIEIDRHIEATRKMSPWSVYQANGWTGGDDTTANHAMQGTLFKGDHLMDNPDRWEDMSAKDHARVLAHAAKFGVTEQSATRAFSTQLDRAHAREDGQHRSFYGIEGVSQSGALLPRTRLKQSAQENNVPFHVQAVSNAINSPQMRFVQSDADGKTIYPNDDTATAAIRWGQSGKTGAEYVRHPDHYVPPEDKIRAVDRKGKPKFIKGTKRPEMIKSPDDPRKYPYQGYPDNFGRSVDVTRAVAAGSTIREAWKPTDADKVKPYHNAWADHDSPEGNFLVSDTHTGAAGFAPHVANTPAEASYLSADGIHAWHDHLARKVIEQRGMISVNRNQSAQWGQEKGEGGNGGDLLHLTASTSAHIGQQFTQMRGQQGFEF